MARRSHQSVRSQNYFKKYRCAEIFVGGVLRYDGWRLIRAPLFRQRQRYRLASTSFFGLFQHRNRHTVSVTKLLNDGVHVCLRLFGDDFDQLVGVAFLTVANRHFCSAVCYGEQILQRRTQVTHNAAPLRLAAGGLIGVIKFERKVGFGIHLSSVRRKQPAGTSDKCASSR